MTPHTNYMICATPRSGSVFLCDALASTGAAGHPEEYFNRLHERRWAARWGLTEYAYADYLEAALVHGATPNSVFGAKIMWWQFLRVARHLRHAPRYSGLDGAEVLHAALPNLHYIWLTRRDDVAQAVSHWKAIQTGTWHVTEGEVPAAEREPVYDFAAIDYLVRETRSHDAAWRRYFTENGIQPFHVVYEEMVHAREETVDDVLAFLGIPTPAASVATPRTTKQADATSDEWIRRYLCAVRP